MTAHVNSLDDIRTNSIAFFASIYSGTPTMLTTLTSAIATDWYRPIGVPPVGRFGDDVYFGIRRTRQIGHYFNFWFFLVLARCTDTTSVVRYSGVSSRRRSM